MPAISCVTGTPSITYSNSTNDLFITAADYPASEEGLHRINCSVITTPNIEFTVAVSLQPNLNASFAEVIQTRLDVKNTMNAPLIYTSPIASDPENNNFQISFVNSSIDYLKIIENANKTFTITLDPTKVNASNAGIQVVIVNLKEDIKSYMS